MYHNIDFPEMVNLLSHYPRLFCEQIDFKENENVALDFIDILSPTYYSMHLRDKIFSEQLWEFFYNIELVLG
jgi:hypothetical protein